MGPASSERTKRWTTSFSRAARSTRCRCPRVKGLAFITTPAVDCPSWGFGDRDAQYRSKPPRRFSMNTREPGTRTIS